MAHLSLYTNENHVDILLIQEPYCYNGAPCYIPPQYLAYYDSSPTDPRATLLIRREISHNFLLLHNYSNPDNVIVVLSSNPPNTYCLLLPPSVRHTRSRPHTHRNIHNHGETLKLHMGYGRKLQAQHVVQPHHRHQGQVAGGLPVDARTTHSEREGRPNLLRAYRCQLD